MDCVQHQQGVGEAERQDGRGDGDVEGPGGDHGEGGGEVPGVLNIICRVKFGNNELPDQQLYFIS